MCKYCDKETKIIEGKENDADVILNGNKLILEAYTFIDDPLTDYIALNINFCPMCGRDLREHTAK